MSCKPRSSARGGRRRTVASGVPGAVLAFPVVGVLGIVLFVATGRTATRVPLEVLTQQLGGAALVAAIVVSIALAVRLRHDAAAHKRLMWPSAVLLQTAGFGRLAALLLGSPVIVLLGLSNAVYDLVALRRVHWASICGAVLALAPVALNTLGSSLGRVPIAQKFAAWLFL